MALGRWHCNIAAVLSRLDALRTFCLKYQVELGAATLFAFEVDSTVHSFSHVFSDGESESRSAALASVRGVRLCKACEQ